MASTRTARAVSSSRPSTRSLKFDASHRFSRAAPAGTFTAPAEGGAVRLVPGAITRVNRAASWEAPSRAGKTTSEMRASVKASRERSFMVASEPTIAPLFLPPFPEKVSWIQPRRPFDIPGPTSSVIGSQLTPAMCFLGKAAGAAFSETAWARG